MTPLNFTIIKILIGLIIGIVLGHYNATIRTNGMYYLGTSLFLFIVIYLYSKNQKKNIWFGCSTLFLSVSIGVFSYYINDDRSYKNHYINKTRLSDSSASSMITLCIRERLKSSSFNHKFIANILTINKNEIHGKILLNIKNDSLHSNLKIDDIILIDSPLKEIPHPLNPYQFNYKNYLEQQNIYMQITTVNNAIYVIQSKRFSLIGFASELRDHINYKLKSAGINGNELAVIKALLLGQRQDIDQELYRSYARAGVVHILAVSGLHVGIILLILNKLLHPIIYLKYGRILKVLLILLLLWGFAIIASLSPSVTRAVTMFSLLAIAMHLKRSTNSYNTLAISALILLIIDPRNLFRVGFQMSYFAVLSILFFQPILSQLWRSKFKIINYFWDIFTVTLAAQIGVLPISLYYFHQFPGLFFIANLLIIPFLGLILFFGLTTILMVISNIVPMWFITFYKSLIRILNSTVNYIGRQSDFIISNISFDIEEVIALYLLIICLGFFITRKTYYRLKQLILSILLMQSVLIFLKFKHNDQQFVIFHKSRDTIIGIESNSSLYVCTDQVNEEIDLPTCISDFAVGNHINDIDREQLKAAYVFQNQSILIVDSLSIYNIKSIDPDFVLLRNSPQIHLNRLIDSINPKMIIADGSNYRSYINRWRITCLKRQLPFHYTGEKGAFIID